VVMRLADYRCELCGSVVEVDLGEPPVGVLMMQHGDACSGRLLRVWGPVAIGSVKGAGGSPSRVGSAARFGGSGV
jgi:hypothetical protein